ncbi:MAG: O-acetyl-ADP-ribose deacetylase [Roseiflexus sp.]|nr:O-acetyl-ADP-ribose deacetylase [Roseiflexus sp.]MCS7288155.1 O-acetyl-ADP-ribose deacetylase [Roseiflexus sp.]MDW8145962.1 O-acetyl-ADP-ribose deacetylase [Roseiflexaceae bacterium]MDW8232579.1 O-acetyl-ADP-ribose deacetylase [Roseiflexaceae bacterium]
MRFAIGDSTLELIRGNIVEQDVDAIVNAANETLAPGGGVSGAIHRAAGPELAEECARIGGCPTGEARITAGYRLKARHVIHAVGPRYTGSPRDAELLASAYRSSLLLAAQHGLRSVAFPSISTGIYGYPLDEAAPIALATCRDMLQSHPQLALVRFVLFDEETFRAYERAAQSIGLAPTEN